MKRMCVAMFVGLVLLVADTLALDVTLKMGEVLNAKPVLEKISRQEVSIDVAYRIASLIKKMNEELSIFDEQRRKLFDRYGKKVEGSDDMTIAEDKKDIYIEELNKLLAVEITMSIDPIDFTEIKDIKVSAADVLLLEKFTGKKEEKAEPPVERK